MNSFFAWIADFFRGMKPWITVMPWEKGIRVRLGKHIKVFGAGFHLKLPYLDEYVVVNTRLRIVPTGTQTISTLDGKTVTAAATVGFLIDDPLESFKKFQNPEGTVAAFSGTVLAKYISSRDLSTITIPDMVLEMERELSSFGGFTFEFVAVNDFAVVKTFRFLQDSSSRAVYSESSTERGVRNF